MNQSVFLQKMTGEQRLEQALQLSDFVKELALSGIKKDFPYLSPKQRMQKYKQRIFKEDKV